MNGVGIRELAATIGCVSHNYKSASAFLGEIAEAVFQKSGKHPDKLFLTKRAYIIFQNEGNELREWEVEIDDNLPINEVVVVAGNGRKYAEVARFSIL